MQPTVSATWGDPYAKNLDMSEEGLVSVEGARRIIKTLSHTGAVGCLILGYNNLGDEGCAELLKYLRSEEGQRHKIASILLNANGLGNVALDSLGGFLRGNKSLKELYLPSNNFVGGSDVIGPFAEALNSSSLKFLSLSSCGGLSDAFAERFFPRLDSPHLSNLQLSTTGLTRTAARHVVEYLSSPRSRRLATLKLSGNNLGVRGALKIVRWINRANFNIVNLEMYGVRTHQGGQGDQGDQSDSSEDDSSKISIAPPGTAIRFEEDLQSILTRNQVLQSNTHTAAFRLLRYSRVLLLKPRGKNERMVTRNPLRIQSLPTELQLYILSLTVDTLSAYQHIRIFQFASDPNTLPEIFPDLRRRQSEGIPGPSLLKKSSSPFTLSPRDANRTQWLRAVGCDLYETR